MKKTILNLGKALNKAEQKTINGGKRSVENENCHNECSSDSNCPGDLSCNRYPCGGLLAGTCSNTDDPNSL